MRVAVALSGGVDSAVAALLLKRQNYDVVGVSFFHEYLPTDASAVAEALNIPYIRIDVSEVFQKYVVEYFTEEYTKGRTPNPCIICNHHIKFGYFRRKAIEVTGATVFATGHYATLTDVSGRRLLGRGADPEYEQSYFLCYLRQEQLRGILFPLGGLLKSEVRRIAEDAYLPVDTESSSRDVCFARGGYRHLFRNIATRRGSIVDHKGRVLGEHTGIFNYTVGQRKGLRLSSGYPLYVLRLEPETKTVVVAPRRMLYASEVSVRDINYPSFKPPELPLRVTARIRYKQPEATATFLPLSDTEAKLVFDEPVFAPARGQFAVFYTASFLLGGGVIES